MFIWLVPKVTQLKTSLLSSEQGRDPVKRIYTASLEEKKDCFIDEFGSPTAVISQRLAGKLYESVLKRFHYKMTQYIKRCQLFLVRYAIQHSPPPDNDLPACSNPYALVRLGSRKVHGQNSRVAAKLETKQKDRISSSILPLKRNSTPKI